MFAAADVVVAQDMLYPRSHPAPMETCGAVADMDPVTGKLTLWCTTQAPHAHRTVYAMVAGLPEHKIRVVSPDIGGGFGNKVPHLPGLRVRDRRLDRDRQAGQVDRGPLGEPHVDRLRARLRNARPDRGDADGKILGRPRQHDRRPRGVQRDRPAEKYPAGFFHIFTGSYDLEAAHCKVTGRLHEQGTRRGRVRLLVPGHRGRLPRRADGRRARPRARDRPGGAAAEEPAAARAVPVRVPDGLGLRLRRLPDGARDGDGHDRLRGAPRASRPRSASAAS